ncbi:MAG: Mrp/NBP35 family ATP-binding protein [Planctomycetaceae bacterium]
MSSSLDANQVRSLIAPLIDPELNRSLGELGVITKVEADHNGVQIELTLPTPAYPHPTRIANLIREALSTLVGETPVEVTFTSKVKGKHAGGNIGLRVANVIAVGSGKGGVGKSTVSASLAYGLLKSGARVGLLDADVYGPSIPHLLGVSGQPEIKQFTTPDGRTIDRIEPLESDGLRMMSMGLMVPAEQAVVWRGPMLHKWLTQLLHQTNWGELDYLIVDMPPGTGDVALTLSQTVQLAGAVVVCTPQQVALLDAVKAVSMFRQVKIPVLGMVENMSGDIFGRGGTRKKAEEMGLPFLGEIPIDPQIRIQGDAGKMSRLFDAESPSREALTNVCQQVALQVVRELLNAPAMPTLEIL